MKLSWKKLVGLFLAVFTLALAGGAAALAEAADAPRGEAGTWMQVYHEKFWTDASSSLTLQSDGTGSMRDGDEMLSLRWTASEDGSVAAVECVGGKYSFDVFGPCIVVSHALDTLMYKYMFDASGARVPEPDYSASEFVGLWEQGSIADSIALAPNGNGRLRGFALYDDYEPVCWWPLADGSGAQFVRGGVSGVEEMRLEDGALLVGGEIYYDTYTLSDEELDAADYQNYPYLTAAPTPEPTPEPAPQLYTNHVYNFYYRDDGIEIMGYVGSDADIEIPETIDNRPVTRIGEQAFFRNETIENVVIPGCVKSIGELAFSECENLETVRIEDGTETIGAMAFALCESMDWVRIPASVTWIGAKVQDRNPYTGFNYLIVDHGSYAEKYAKTQGGKYTFYTYAAPDAADVPAGLDVQPGNVVRFGSADWLVLKREGGRALLLRWGSLARNMFDYIGDVVWSESTLHQWLNESYVYSFDDAEREIIEQTVLFTPNNPDSSMPLDYPPTMDRVFLLSYGEVNKLLPDEAARKAYMENGMLVSWWLRTDGGGSSYNMVVNKDGSLGESKDTSIAGVRPALWVDLTRAEGLVEFEAEDDSAMYGKVAEASRERLSGTWINAYDEDGSNRACILTLNADGTGSYALCDLLAAPTTTYDSYSFEWTCSDESITLTHDGVEEVLSVHDESLSMQDGHSLMRSSQYDAMMQSAQENSWMALDALLGVWEVQSAEADGCKYNVTITLQPDGGALLALRSLRLSDNSVVEEIETERSCPWVMTPGGIRITLPEGDREFGFGDGTITVDSATLPAVKVADLSQWQTGMDGGQYAYSAYHDFSDSKCIGVWEYSRIVDEYDNIRGEIYLCLAKDGSGAIVDVYSGKNIAVEWAPSDRGIDVASLPGEMELLDIGLHEGEKNTLVMTEDGYLEWSTGGMSGILSFEKIEDSFEPGEVYQPAPTATPIPTLAPAPDPATIQAELPQPNQEVMSVSSALETLPVTQFMSGIDVFEFDKLWPKYVSNSEMEPDGANQAFTVYLQPGVSIGGTKGYAQNWVSERGVLCDAALDLDGDGQEECLVYEVEGQVDDGYDYSYYKPIGHLVVYDSRDGEYVEADRVEILGSLMPEGDSEVRIVNTDSGIYIADMYIRKWYETETQVTMNLYRYDGERFQRVLSADISDSSNSALVSGSFIVKDLSRDLNLWEISEAVSRYDSNGDPGALEDLGLTIDENLLLSFISEDESGMAVRDQTVFETLNAELAAYGLNLAYVTSDRGSETGIVGQIIESIRLDGGEIFLSAIDSYSSLYTWEGDARFVLCTSLDHRPGPPEDEGTSSGSDGTTAYYSDDYYMDDYYNDDYYDDYYADYDYDDDYYEDAYYMDDYSTAAYD